MLSEAKDRLGMNKLAVDWRLTPLDLKSFREFQKTLFDTLGKMGYPVRAFNHELDDLDGL